MPHFFDAHCHLDFCSNCDEIASRAEGIISAIDSTVFPSSYVSASAKLAGSKGVKVALGMHPWQVAQGRVGENDLLSFERLVGDVSMVGEVGLDYSKGLRESRARQLEVLTRILQSIEASGGGKVVFLHSVKSCPDMMMLLDRFGTCSSNVCVFHWFQGTLAELERAVSAGCMFSVGIRMLASAKGRELALAIPADRLLAETDGPAHPGVEWSAEAWIQLMDVTVKRLAEVRGADEAEMRELLTANGQRLLCA